MSLPALSLSQKVYVVKSYYKHDEDAQDVLHNLRTAFKLQIAQDQKNIDAIQDLIQMFETLGSVLKPCHYVPDVLKEQTTEEEEEVVEVEVVFEDEHFGEDLEIQNEESRTSTTADEEECPSTASFDAPPPAPHADGERKSARRVFRCTTCSKVFGEEEHLQIHLSIHSAEDKMKRYQYICDVCGKNLKDRRAYTSHMLLHSTERPFKCTFCPKSFSRHGGLQQHLRIHTGERPYTCKHCPATFSTFTSRQLHERRHTGEKPYQCQHCPERFIGRSALNHHLRTHAGEYIYLCQFCENRFKFEKTLKEHLEAKHNIITDTTDGGLWKEAQSCSEST